MLICGENPCAFFFHPKTKMLEAAISYWSITYSEHGSGKLLFVGRPGNDGRASELRCLTDNLSLANQIYRDFNRHFEIFRNFRDAPEYVSASLNHAFDGKFCYEVFASNDASNIQISWFDLQHPEQTNVKIDGFGEEGTTRYSVYATIITCSAARLIIDGREECFVLGERYGAFTSSAFLSIAESWCDFPL